jgi:putative endonuclease
MTNYEDTTLYIGITNDLIRRVYEHKNKLLKGFTEKYNLNKLVYYEIFYDIEYAIQREKQLKKFLRKSKNRLITKFNKGWVDLYLKDGQILTLPLVAENDNLVMEK